MSCGCGRCSRCCITSACRCCSAPWGCSICACSGCSGAFRSARCIGSCRSGSPLGYGLNLLTGLAFFSGHPDQYAYNSAFHWKLVFMSLAALNVAAFYTTAFKALRQLPPQASAPPLARALTAVSWGAGLACAELRPAAHFLSPAILPLTRWQSDFAGPWTPAHAFRYR